MLTRKQSMAIAALAAFALMTSVLMGVSALGRAGNMGVRLWDSTVMMELLTIHLVAGVMLLVSCLFLATNGRRVNLFYCAQSLYAILGLTYVYAGYVSVELPPVSSSFGVAFATAALVALPFTQIFLCMECLAMPRALATALGVAAIVSMPASMLIVTPENYTVVTAGVGPTCVMCVVFLIQLALIVIRLAQKKTRPSERLLGMALLAVAYLFQTIVQLFGIRSMWIVYLSRHVLLLALVLSLAYVFRMERFNGRRLKTSLEELASREETYRISARQEGKLILRYDVHNDRISCWPDAAPFEKLGLTLEGSPEALIQEGRVDHRSSQAFLAFFRDIRSGRPEGAAVVGGVTADGRTVWLRLDSTTLFDESNAPLYAVVTCAESKGTEERLTAYRKRRDAYDAMDQHAVSFFEGNLTADRHIYEGGALLAPPPEGFTPAELLAYLSERYIDERDRPAFLHLLNRARLLECYAQDIRAEAIDVRRVDGDKRLWTRVSVQLLADPFSSDILAFLLLEDTQDERERIEREKARATLDEVTGLFTRAAFREQFEEMRLSAPMEGASHVIIMLDLDGFKAVNDTFGHQFGDRVLIDVATDLRAMMRADDLLGRLGGDEFMICLKNAPLNSGFLERRCQTICRVLSKQFGDDVAITCSMGLALYPKDGADFETLYKHADQALYTAKEGGRNRFVFYSPGGVKAANGASSAVEPSQPEHREAAARRHSLLIVDDQAINRGILMEIFREDYDVYEAAGGQQALDMLRGAQHAVSAVLLDLIMPEVDGLAVLREMNLDPYYQAIPVIVVSAADESEYGLRAIDLGATDFVTKPIDAPLVKLRVRNAIQRREMENLRAQNRALLARRADEARHQRQLSFLADHDPLTHIYNKTAFYRETRALLAKSTDAPYCLVSLDIQRFRAINDMFGMEEGDRLLNHVAFRMREEVHGHGVYGRVDTDRFGMCLPYDRGALEALAESMMRSMKEYDLSFEIALRFGVYIIRDRDMPVSRLYDRADIARRTIGEHDIQRLAVYEENMNQLQLDQRDILTSMDAALKQDEFVLHYQPRHRLDTGAVSGVEALVRWNHPTRGMLSPATFLPAFERSGFVAKLDGYVWDQACAFLARHAQTALRVSVNLATAHLYNPALCDEFLAACQRHGVNPKRLEVEFSEAAYMENARLLLSATESFRAQGVRVMMDGFGSGFSSVAMLREIPVDALKLDRRLLVVPNERALSILRGIADMAHRLALPLVAEGVETKEQVRLLRDIGCEQAQGYAFSRPMTEEALTRLLSGEGPNPSQEEHL